MIYTSYILCVNSQAGCHTPGFPLNLQPLQQSVFTTGLFLEENECEEIYNFLKTILFLEEKKSQEIYNFLTNILLLEGNKCEDIYNVLKLSSFWRPAGCLPLQISKGGVPLTARSIHDLSQTSSWRKKFSLNFPSFALQNVLLFCGLVQSFLG